MSADDQVEAEPEELLVIKGGKDNEGGGGVVGPPKHDVTGLKGLSDDVEELVDKEHVMTGDVVSDVLCLRDLRIPCKVLYRLKQVARLR